MGRVKRWKGDAEVSGILRGLHIQYSVKGEAQTCAFFWGISGSGALLF